MPLSGAHIACGYVNAFGGAALLGKVIWSQTMSGAGTTTQAAPNQTDAAIGPGGFNLAFEVRASSDVYVAVGAAPDATNGPRAFVPANETRNFFCRPGDRLAWALA